MKRSKLVSTDDPGKLRRKLPTEMNCPTHLCGSTLDHRAHVCAFFNSADEKYSVLLPFIVEGLELGQKNVQTVDPLLRDEHCRRLESAGVDMETVLETGQFDLRDWNNTHLLKGEFDQHKTLAMFQEIMDDAAREGFPLTRFVTDMGWALEAGLDANELLEYEATANKVWIQQDGPVNPVICTYDLNRFTADIIVDVIRTHPTVIIGGLLRENPFFVPPEEFLEELRGRKPIPLRKVG
jgi:MEDS: MEthanogen/methylotroph, DcmR Sensory domain